MVAAYSSFIAFLAKESAWRTVTIWLGVWALFYEIMLRKIGDWLLPLFGINAPPLPTLSADLWEIIAAILGGGGLSLLARYTDTVISRPPAEIHVDMPVITEAIADIDEKIRSRRKKVDAT